MRMRRDLDSSLEEIRKGTELVQKRVDEKTTSLEAQSDKVSVFLASAEKQLSSKVTNEELSRVSKSFAEQLQETRNVIQAQMDVVRGRVERSTEDFSRVVTKMDDVAMRTEVLPISEKVTKLQVDLGQLTAEVGTKAAEEDVAHQVGQIQTVQADHKAQLLTKADEAAVVDRHERYVRESTNAINGLREVTEHLGISINSVEESVNLVAAQTGTKAETRDVHEMMKMNEAVQSQVSGLKAELQGTLKALETWILEQNTKKTHGMKLQPKPADSSAPAAKAAAPAAAPPQASAADEKLQHRVGELERQLMETQALLYAQTGAQTMRGDPTGAFGGGFPPPAGVPDPYALNAGKLDASGAFLMPGDAYTNQMMSPRPPPPRKGGKGSSKAASEAGDAAQAPFKSQGDRRQWLLQEKRKWLVEMRLGDGGGAPPGSGQAPPTPSKLPPIPLQ